MKINGKPDGGGSGVITSLSVTSNGTYTAGSGVDGYSEVVVSVPQSATGYTINDVATGYYNLTTLNCSVSWVRAYAFISQSSLTTVNLPNCEQLGGYRYTTTLRANQTGCVFSNCSNLTNVNLPVCRIIYQGNFTGCDSLQSITLPLCVEINTEAFRGCKALSLVDLSVCSYLGNSVFYISDNTVHLSVILRSNTVCLSGGQSVFRSKTNFSIYVPSSLVDAYKTAWSNYSNKIYSIPE